VFAGFSSIQRIGYGSPQRRSLIRCQTKSPPRGHSIALLSGIYDSGLIHQLHLPAIGSEEMIAVTPKDKDEEALMKRLGVIA
jgi:hypothetical protein